MKTISVGNWYYRIMEYVLYSLVFLVPLAWIPNHIAPFMLPKVFLITAGAILLLGLYVWGRACEKESMFSISFVDGMLAAFALVLLISTAMGVVPQFAFFGSTGSGMGAMVFLAGISIAYTIGFLVKRNSDFLKTLSQFVVWGAVAVVALLYGGEKLIPMSAQAGTIGNTSYTGAYLLLVSAFTFIAIYQSGRTSVKVLYSLAWLFIITSPIFLNHDIIKGKIGFAEIAANPLVVSGSANGACIGMGIAVVIAGILFLVRRKNPSLQWIGAGSFVVFIGLLFALGQILMSPHTALHKKYFQEKNGNRFVFWEVADRAVRDHPWFGWGMNGYAYAFQEKSSVNLFYPGYVQELWTDNPHNMFKEMQVSTGFVGLSVYLILLGGSAIALFRGTRSDNELQKVASIVFLSVLAGYVFQNLFIFDTPVPLLFFFIIVGYAAAIGPAKIVVVSKKYYTLKKVSAAVLVAGLVYSAWAWVVMPWKESVAWATYTGKNTITTAPNPQSISELGYVADTAYLLDKLLVFITHTYVPNETPRETKDRHSESIKILIAAIEKEILDEGRDNFRAEWVIGRAYMKLVELEGGIGSVHAKEYVKASREHLDRALAINALNPFVYQDMARTYIYENTNIKQSLPWARAAIALAPEFEGNYGFALGLIKYRIGDKAFADYVETMRQKWCDEESLCINASWK